MRDIERSVIPPVDLLYRGDLLTKKNNNNESMSNAGSCCTFLLAREGPDLRAKIPDMLDYLKTIYWPYTRGIYRGNAPVPCGRSIFRPSTATEPLVGQPLVRDDPHGNRHRHPALRGIQW